MDRGAWRATVHEVMEWTQLKSLNNNNWSMCILHKGERGEKETMRKEDGDVEKRIRQRSNDVRMMEIRDKSNMNRNVKTKMKQIT